MHEFSLDCYIAMQMLADFLANRHYCILLNWVFEQKCRYGGDVLTRVCVCLVFGSLSLLVFLSFVKLFLSQNFSVCGALM